MSRALLGTNTLRTSAGVSPREMADKKGTVTAVGFPCLSEQNIALPVGRKAEALLLCQGGSETLRNGSASVYEEYLLIALSPKPRGC